MNEQISANGNPQRERTAIPDGESREEKFVRLALQRMPNVQKHMRLIGNLAAYPHTEEQRLKILTELRKLVAEVESAFAPTNRRDGFTF
jgi:hypothetical protein